MDLKSVNSYFYQKQQNGKKVSIYVLQMDIFKAANCGVDIKTNSSLLGVRVTIPV